MGTDLQTYHLSPTYRIFFLKTFIQNCLQVFKIYIFPSCIYRIPTQHLLWVAMKHIVQNKKMVGGETGERMEKKWVNISFMVTVTGEYCAFIRRNCPDWNV